ncbi:geranylgeranylglycerol-phosphate geranylgeranyltransferase [Thermococcus gammatolerans]|uniref:Digeranylgeranylglyceryl phosphate synthase n=1 Tax=Thermococcus gammatolerans (strain DSM 15229 / JCM 11827 / EJ3) TaxID=593117 RepID=DGGGP_THEGJ|nr:geranylgeranylglycerol-phosphate geranylgeranyltransferase [Thermococcus gammatolerans]C5A1J7.1 RecName: Full=Digeranylgeranylglyceryl phosphate synthase; Short=DGGGP synthase; Short=DGGGPS; AltName: Full=(S)-2,3-di-O-geranylgeranylglyceryl phosphate synthase; AltName: Full=Geranylgeranylglycerol-phosphate geranylgeranyltransferase [Thermococcus gammatolerans EJ3]ACS34266.1 Prenyltransferase, UbiA family, Putative 4-hydroxybenzoate octaprenyltransferase [Thermococcus gammatolerans EJ3]
MELRAFVEITRPHNCALAGLVGVLGSMVALGSVPEGKILILVFLVVSLGCAGGNTINDYFDYEIDRINRPERPLPRGAMDRRTALWYSLFLFAVGLALALLISLKAFAFALLAYITMFLYAWKLKPLPFIGNIAVAALTGVTPLYGAIAVGKIGLAGTLAVCAFLVNVAREIVKDIEDVEGDLKKGAKTLPIILGRRKAAYVAAFFGVATVIASFLPVKAGVGVGYYAMVPVDLIILYAVYLILRNQDEKTAHRSQLLLKASIFLAVFAFLIAALM